MFLRLIVWHSCLGVLWEKEEVLGGMLFWFIRDKLILVINVDGISECSDEIKTSLAIFIVPKFRVNDGAVPTKELFGTFKNKILKIFYIKFDTVDGLPLQER